jgi:hypothetical protein
MAKERFFDIVERLTRSEQSLKINSSVTALERFVDSSLHQDFLNEIDMWLLDLCSKNEDPTCEYSVEELRQFQGAIQALRNLSQIFKVMIKNKKDQLMEAKEIRDGKES